MEILQFIKKKQFWAVIALFLVANSFLLVYDIWQERDIGILSGRQITKQEYQTIVENREKAHQQAVAFQVFANENSFAGKNRIKEQKDYKNSSKIQVEEGNNRVITAVISNHKTSWLLLFFVCYLVFQFHREREGAMWYVMHSLPKGRGILGAKRCGILVILTTIFGLFLYMNSFVLSSFFLGGNVGWNRGIQSIEAFITIPQAFSIWQFSFLFVFVHILGCCCVGFFLFFVFSCCKEKLVAFICIAIIGIVEYLLTLLPIQSNLVLVKIWNLFSFVNMTDYLSVYRNIPIPFGILMEMLPLSVITCVITGSLLFIGTFYVNQKIMPSRKESIVHRFFVKKLDYLRRVLLVLPNIGLELYKQIIGQRKWSILFLLCIICFYKETPSLYFASPQEAFLDEFYTNFSGTIKNEKADAYMENLDREIAEAKKEQRIIKSELKNGGITTTEYEERMRAISIIDSKIEGYEYICKERTRLKNLQNSTGIDMEYVNPRIYDQICHQDFWNKENKTALFIMFTLLLLLFDIGSYEKKVGMNPILCSTSRGCSMLFQKKAMVVIFYGIFTGVLVYGSNLWNIIRSYGRFTGLNAPIQSLACLNKVTLHCPIWLYLAGFYLLRLFVIVLFSLLVYGISCLLSPLSTFVFVFCIGIIPSLLYYLGIEQAGVISFSKILAFLHYPGQKMKTYVIYMGVLMLGTIGSLLIGKKACFMQNLSIFINWGSLIKNGRKQNGIRM